MSSLITIPQETLAPSERSAINLVLEPILPLVMTMFTGVSEHDQHSPIGKAFANRILEIRDRHHSGHLDFFTKIEPTNKYIFHEAVIKPDLWWFDKRTNNRIYEGNGFGVALERLLEAYSTNRFTATMYAAALNRSKDVYVKSIDGNYREQNTTNIENCPETVIFIGGFIVGDRRYAMTRGGMINTNVSMVLYYDKTQVKNVLPSPDFLNSDIYFQKKIQSFQGLVLVNHLLNAQRTFQHSRNLGLT